MNHDPIHNALVIESVLGHLGPYYAPIARLVCRDWRAESDRIHGIPGKNVLDPDFCPSEHMYTVLIKVNCAHFARLWVDEEFPPVSINRVERRSVERPRKAGARRSISRS